MAHNTVTPANMSKHMLPLLFLNMSGEMIYVLDQRLRAQAVPLDKAKKGNLK